MTSFIFIKGSLACVASVSSRVIARKLEREQLSSGTRAETVAMQAKGS